MEAVVEPRSRGADGAAFDGAVVAVWLLLWATIYNEAKTIEIFVYTVCIRVHSLFTNRLCC